LTPPKLAQEQVEALYQRHAAGVLRFLLGVLRDRDLSEEALQATFLKVMEKGHTADEETMKGWIYKVAFHQAMALRRRQQTGGRLMGQLALHPDLLREVVAREDVDQTGEQVIANETLDRTIEEVRRLPAEQQDVLRMRFTEAKTFAQIADQLGVPLGTALTRMRLALTKLRKRLPS
jgi:RNA polymerase sigma-70 factor, ECF subfamily